mmetsp:Transcript_57512/g.165079  ORF Transcript_57512/g.165079 Transcript_57512/m.165079 type:complete len:207 (+) Transcript_57512:247-867(+)
MPEGVSEGPASEVLIEFLEGVESHVGTTAGRGLFAASDLAKHAEDVDAGDPECQHTPVEVLVLAPGLRQQKPALREAFDIGRDRAGGEHLDGAVEAEATVVDVDRGLARLRTEVVTLDEAAVQAPVEVAGEVASFKPSALAAAIHRSWPGRLLESVSATHVLVGLQPLHVLVTRVDLSTGQRAVLAAVTFRKLLKQSLLGHELSHL